MSWRITFPGLGKVLLLLRGILLQARSASKFLWALWLFAAQSGLRMQQSSRIWIVLSVGAARILVVRTIW
jgi:hypothetical protein